MRIGCRREIGRGARTLKDPSVASARLEIDSDLGPLLEWPEFKALFASWREQTAASERVFEASSANWEDLVVRADKPVLVDFTATWCGPCRALAPIVEKLAVESFGRYRVVKLDVDESPDIAKRYGVAAMPTLIVLVNGEERGRHVGLTNKAKLKELVATSGAFAS